MHITGVGSDVRSGAVADTTFRMSGGTPEWQTSNKCQNPMATPDPTRMPKIEPNHVSQPVKPLSSNMAKKKIDNIITLMLKARRTSTFFGSAPFAIGLNAT